MQDIRTKMGLKWKDREGIEEDIDYPADIEKDVEEVEVKRRRVAKDEYVQLIGVYFYAQMCLIPH
jgi:uncharacterized lipoprotein YehR (DUF1307 family)